MDFDFFFKLVLTASFFGVSICLCIKWVVESYLDYIQVKTGIRVATIQSMKDSLELEEKLNKRGNDDDPTAY
jgi:hypothetical protein